MTEHQDKDSRREQILDAAARLFIARGFENSSVDEVAREAGLSKGSIYWYFKSKLEILFELTDRCVLESQSALRRFAESDTWGPEALYTSHRYLQESKIHDEIHDRIFHQLHALADHYPEIRTRLAEYHRKWDELTSSLIQRGVDDGFFKPCDTLRIAQAISALYEGLHTRRILEPSLDVVAVLECIMKHVYDAIVITPDTTPEGVSK